MRFRSRRRRFWRRFSRMVRVASRLPLRARRSRAASRSPPPPPPARGVPARQPGTPPRRRIPRSFPHGTDTWPVGIWDLDPPDSFLICSTTSVSDHAVQLEDLVRAHLLPEARSGVNVVALPRPNAAGAAGTLARGGARTQPSSRLAMPRLGSHWRSFTRPLSTTTTTSGMGHRGLGDVCGDDDFCARRRPGLGTPRAVPRGSGAECSARFCARRAWARSAGARGAAR